MLLTSIKKIHINKINTLNPKSDGKTGSLFLSVKKTAELSGWELSYYPKQIFKEYTEKNFRNHI